MTKIWYLRAGVCLSFLCLMLGCAGCGKSYEEIYDEGYKDGYNSGLDEGKEEGDQIGYENGLMDGQSEGYDEGYDEGYEDATLRMTEDGYLSSVIQIIDEATSNAKTTQQLFDLCDEVGYYPSSLLGEYCYNRDDLVIHKCDSDCVNKLKEKNITPFIVYLGVSESTDDLESLDSVKELISKNEYLKGEKFTYCSVCLQK